MTESKKNYADETALLNGIKIGDQELDGFDNDITSYSVNVSSLSGTVPEITAEAVSEDVKVEVTKPESLPGTATVKATAKSGFSRTYTIEIKNDTSIQLSDLGYDTARSTSGYNGIHVNEDNAGTELDLYVEGKRTKFEKGFGVNADSSQYFDIEIPAGTKEICLYADKNVKDGHDMVSWCDTKVQLSTEELTTASLTFDLSGIKAERFEGYVDIDYTKSTKTNRDGANFIFYKDCISEENKLAESGVILQPDNAKFMNVDLTGVEKLIIYIDKVGGKNDDCVDIADAKVYVKEDDNNPDQPSKDELEKIKKQAVAAKNDAETAAKAAEEAQKKAEEILAKAQKEAEEKRAEAQKQLEEVQAMQKRLERQLAKTEFAAKKVKVKAVKGVKKSVKVNWKSVEGQK